MSTLRRITAWRHPSLARAVRDGRLSSGTYRISRTLILTACEVDRHATIEVRPTLPFRGQHLIRAVGDVHLNHSIWVFQTLPRHVRASWLLGQT